MTTYPPGPKPVFVLNPGSPLPLYHQLAERLSAEIAKGQWCPGDKLPSEPELARLYAIGRPTVRQATELLVRRGLAERRRGSGTFVRSAPHSVDLFTMAGTVSSFRSSGHTLDTELLDGPRLTTVDVKDSTHPYAGRAALYYRRLGRLEGKPVLVEDVHLNPQTFPDLQRAPLHTTPLSQVVRQRYHLEPSDGEQSFHVTDQPQVVAEALCLPRNQQLLLIQRTLNFPNAQAAIFSRLYCRTDCVTFTQRLGAASL